MYLRGAKGTTEAERGTTFRRRSGKERRPAKFSSETKITGEGRNGVAGRSSECIRGWALVG